jgi:glycosyltransferase involved in cell wall biosynthesis
MKKILKNTIISLTSYPARIDTVHVTIKNLLNQTVKAEKCILWLSKEEFPAGEKELPKSLLALTKKGLTIEWCKNLKSYKKLIPALKNYPEKIIITFDDDTIYNKKTVEFLYNCHTMYPNDIVAHRVYRKYFNETNDFENFQGQLYYDKKSRSYKNYESIKTSSFFNRLVGEGGVLYPPDCLHNEVLNEQKFTLLAPANDDIWFYLHAVYKKTKVHIPDIYFHNNQSIPNSQNVGLTHINTKESSFQTFKNTINAYPEIMDILQSENNENTEIINKIIDDNEYPLISIICFSYNHESSIRQCLDSILNQKIKVPFEIIIIDNASTDQTLNIITEYERVYPKKIKSYRLPPSIKNIFKKLNGEYAAFCNGNDYWTDPYKLYKQFDFIEGKLEYSVISSGFIENRNGTIIDKTIKCGEITGFDYINLEIRGEPHWKLSTLFCRKSSLSKFINQYSRIKTFNDIHLIYFLLKAGYGRYFSENLVTHNTQNKNTEEEIIAQYKCIKELYKTTRDKLLSDLYYKYLNFMLKNNHYKNKIEKLQLKIELNTKDLSTILIAIKRYLKLF